MNERTTVRLPPELLNRARRKAAAEGRTLTSLIEDGLRLMVMTKHEPGKKRILPRVSNATGGANPGFEQDPFGATEELDDLEHIERLKHFK